MMRIGFAFNSHWAIRLLNRFESGFSVNRPLISITYQENLVDVSRLLELTTFLKLVLWKNWSFEVIFPFPSCNFRESITVVGVVIV